MAPWKNTLWKNLVVALVAAFALAACSSSDNGTTTSMPDPGPDPAMACTDGGGQWNADDMTCTSAENLAAARAAAQRTAINSAITAADTAVTGLADDASDTAISAAETAVAAAKKAVSDAADVPDTEQAAFNTTIATIEGILNTKKTSIADAHAATAKVNAALGKAMYAALGPPATADGTRGALAAFPLASFALSATGFRINPAAGAGALPNTTDPGRLVLEAGDSAGSLGGWMGTDYALSTGTGDAKVTNEARIYTNAAPTTEAFGDRHTLADGSLTVSNYGLVKAIAFTHSGTQNHVVPDRLDAVYVRGTYDGAPGEYSCTTGCSSTNDGSGSPSTLGGTWTFTPDKGAMVSVPDPDYVYFGWWERKDGDGGLTAASAFYGATSQGSIGLGRATTGSASYVGHAAGKFAMSNPLDGTGSGGHFTADAVLKVTFGTGTTAGATGTIDNFRLNDGSEDPGWSVALARGALSSGGGGILAPPADATVWSINGNKAPASGSWRGTLFDELLGATDADPPGDGSNIATTVAGEFYSEFGAIGRMVGGFGGVHEQ